MLRGACCGVSAAASLGAVENAETRSNDLLLASRAELQKASSHVFVVCVGRIYDLTTGLLPSESCRWVVGSGVVVGWATPR